MHKIYQLILLTGCLILFCCSSNLTCLPAAAVLREHHESPGVLRYHAHTSIKDKKGMTWQVVLFPEYESNRLIKYHLRLVGFPGIVQFIHPQPLEIITSEGEVLSAKDIISDSSFAPNVGEFDLTGLLPILPKKGFLKLSTILYDDSDLSLSIPESTLIEWQWLAR
ncbi:MAG: DUF3122 domain-containing protein [Xenococcaceae cyanobacterium MO_188.B19]|nr:DUF3122 domain-containing protein [Xenococcaceae cyanobacterium MO_188.B19]